MDHLSKNRIEQIVEELIADPEAMQRIRDKVENVQAEAFEAFTNGKGLLVKVYADGQDTEWTEQAGTVEFMVIPGKMGGE